MINKCLFSLLVFGIFIGDISAYNADSGECMLMENIMTMLGEYRTYGDQKRQIDLEIANYSGNINSAQAAADSARSDVEKLNKSASTKSNWAGGLALTATAANVVSIGMLGGAIHNNKKTMNNLNAMHDTLSNVDITSGEKAMKKTFDKSDVATNLNDIISLSKCFKEVEGAKHLVDATGNKLYLNEDEEFYLKGQYKKIDIPYLAFRGSGDDQQVCNCGEKSIKRVIVAFSGDAPYCSALGCKWEEVATLKKGNNKGDVAKLPEELLKDGVNAINDGFKQIAVNGSYDVYRKNKDSESQVGSVNCENGAPVFTKKSQ